MRAIDGDHLKSILQEYVKREEAYAESGNFFDNLISTCVAAGLLEAIHSIEEEPPAQPDWIPCSKRLPEEETDVLVCNANGDIEISSGSYSTEVKDFIWYTSGWRFGTVIAWMPLPKPWKGEENE